MLSFALRRLALAIVIAVVAVTALYGMIHMVPGDPAIVIGGPNASAAEIEYQMKDGGATIFVAENQEYVDKILALTDRLPALAHIVVQSN